MQSALLRTRPCCTCTHNVCVCLYVSLAPLAQGIFEHITMMRLSCVHSFPGTRTFSRVQSNIYVRPLPRMEEKGIKYIHHSAAASIRGRIRTVFFLLYYMYTEHQPCTTMSACRRRCGDNIHVRLAYIRPNSITAPPAARCETCNPLTARSGLEGSSNSPAVCACVWIPVLSTVNFVHPMTTFHTPKQYLF